MEWTNGFADIRNWLKQMVNFTRTDLVQICELLNGVSLAQMVIINTTTQKVKLYPKGEFPKLAMTDKDLHNLISALNTMNQKSLYSLWQMMEDSKVGLGLIPPPPPPPDPD